MVSPHLAIIPNCNVYCYILLSNSMVGSCWVLSPIYVPTRTETIYWLIWFHLQQSTLVVVYSASEDVSMVDCCILIVYLGCLIHCSPLRSLLLACHDCSIVHTNQFIAIISSYTLPANCNNHPSLLLYIISRRQLLCCKCSFCKKTFVDWVSIDAPWLIVVFVCILHTLIVNRHHILYTKMPPLLCIINPNMLFIPSCK